MGLEEFKSNLIRNQKKKFKVSNSWGVYDSYKHIRKNGWYNIGRPVTEHEFYTIVRKMNDLLAENLFEHQCIVFPSRMGTIELRKHKKGVKIVNGKLKVTYPVDWRETWKLWYSDEQARKDKILIRFEIPYVIRAVYNKYTANYENKSFYEFTLNRNLKRKLKDKIQQGKIDTLW